jgi:tRNA threonylcarbamoyladenosine biosynthesis protein TsaE
MNIGRTLTGGEVILLIGELGCGKTAFTKGVALGLYIEDVITSPSFSLLNEYRGRLDLYHFDFYRIDDRAEIESLLEDYIYKPGAVTVIEWGEKTVDLLDDYLLFRFEILNGARRIRSTRREV